MWLKPVRCSIANQVGREMLGFVLFSHWHLSPATAAADPAPPSAAAAAAASSCPAPPSAARVGASPSSFTSSGGEEAGAALPAPPSADVASSCPAPPSAAVASSCPAPPSAARAADYPFPLRLSDPFVGGEQPPFSSPALGSVRHRGAAAGMSDVLGTVEALGPQTTALISPLRPASTR